MMAGLSALRVTSGELREIEQLARRTSARQGPNWRHDLLQVRRELAGLQGRLAEQVRVPRADVTALAEPLAALAASISDLRRRVALHQAEWPVSAIDSRPADYLGSTTTLRDGYAAVFASFDALDRAWGRASSKE